MTDEEPKLYGSSHKQEASYLKFNEPLKHVGSYEIVKGGHIYWNFTAKPNWWHRFWTKQFLGWTWRDHHDI